MIYVCGPMSGFPNYNMPAFARATEALAGDGFDPVNPGRDYDPNASYTWEGCMRSALGDLLKCDSVALLPGWADSRGATLEIYVATQIGLDVRPLAEWLT